MSEMLVMVATAIRDKYRQAVVDDREIDSMELARIAMEAKEETMAQYVYATPIFEIKCRAMQDALSIQSITTEERIAMPTGLLHRASAILEWYLADLPKTTDMRDSRV